jgi:hypothetical protein
VQQHHVNAVLQIHWFSIINSCVTVLLLTGFLATILMRVLKNDFIKYTRDDEASECPQWCHRRLSCYEASGHASD